MQTNGFKMSLRRQSKATKQLFYKLSQYQFGFLEIANNS